MNFPKEILEEILSRLPVKSLFRFTCVSKLFHCIISCDSQFHNKHVKNYSRNMESKRLFTHVDYNVTVSCSLYSAYYNDTITWRPNYTSRSCIPVTIHCPSINGLFCLSLDQLNAGIDHQYASFEPLGLSLSNWFEICLWNPTINELRPLPNSTCHVERSGWEPFYGFGYDSTNDDYVVVRVITRFSRPLYQGYPIKVELYSLKHDSWRLIQPFPYHVIFNQRTYFSCHFVNNRFHWISPCDIGGRYDSPKWMIVSLDLSNDEYNDIPLPNYEKVPRNFSYNDAISIDIVVLHGLLCMFIYCCGHSFDMWTMKEYGVEESWTITFSIPQDDIMGTCDGNTPIDLINSRLFWRMVPLYLFENGDVLFETENPTDKLHKKKIVIYKKDMKVLKTWLGNQTTHIARARGGSFIYTESLISPNRYMTRTPSRIAKLGDRLIQRVSY